MDIAHEKLVLMKRSLDNHVRSRRFKDQRKDSTHMLRTADVRVAMSWNRRAFRR